MATITVSIKGMDELTRHIAKINEMGLTCPKCGYRLLPKQGEADDISTNNEDDERRNRREDDR